MYFSTAAIIAVATCMSSIPATTAKPINNTTTANPFSGSKSIRPADVVAFLDSNYNLNWTQAGDSGRMAFVSEDLMQKARTNLTSGLSGGLTKRWSSSGQIDGLTAEYSCFGSGVWGVSSVMKGYVTNACSHFASGTSVGAAANTAWTLWQGSPMVPSASGSQSTIDFLFRKVGNTPPTLTETLCENAYDLLTTSVCQGTGNNIEDTQGGTVQVGDGSTGAIEFSVDPNSPGSTN